MANEKETPELDEELDGEDEVEILELTDDETGEKLLYAQEMIIPVNGESYALLVPYTEDDGEDAEHTHEHGEDCDCCDDDDAAFFAKIVIDEHGEETYEVPSDEEFDAVMAAYDKIMAEEDEAEA